MKKIKPFNVPHVQRGWGSTHAAGCDIYLNTSMESRNTAHQAIQSLSSIFFASITLIIFSLFCCPKVLSFLYGVGRWIAHLLRCCKRFAQVAQLSWLLYWVSKKYFWDIYLSLIEHKLKTISPIFKIATPWVKIFLTLILIYYFLFFALFGLAI